MDHYPQPPFVTLSEVESPPMDNDCLSVSPAMTTPRPYCEHSTAAPGSCFCDVCFSHAFDNISSPLSPVGERPFIPNLDGPQPHFQLSQNAFRPTSTAPVPDSFTFPQTINDDGSHMAAANVRQLVESTYTPGFIAPEYHPDYLADQVDKFALVTPAPTSATEASFKPQLLQVRDFVHGTNQAAYLDSEPDTYMAAAELKASIENKGFRVSPVAERDDDSAIKSLQKSMSFNLQHVRKCPYTMEQLRNMQQTARKNTSRTDGYSTHPIKPNELTMVLDSYNVHTGIQFQLGVVSWSHNQSYQVSMYRVVPEASATIWLFYDRNGDVLLNPNQWAPIIPPYQEGNRSPSYASVVANPPPVQPAAAPAVAPFDPKYLNPGPRYTSSRKRSNKSHQSSGSVKGGPSTKNHRCRHAHCDKAFLYPKDLRRHEATHSGAKPYGCSFCSKAFTRRDNRTRHMRDDHGDRPPTPSISSVASTSRR